MNGRLKCSNRIKWKRRESLPKFGCLGCSGKHSIIADKTQTKSVVDRSGEFELWQERERKKERVSRNCRANSRVQVQPQGDRSRFPGTKTDTSTLNSWLTLKLYSRSYSFNGTNPKRIQNVDAKLKNQQSQTFSNFGISTQLIRKVKVLFWSNILGKRDENQVQQVNGEDVKDGWSHEAMNKLKMIGEARRPSTLLYKHTRSRPVMIAARLVETSNHTAAAASAKPTNAPTLT